MSELEKKSEQNVEPGVTDLSAREAQTIDNLPPEVRTAVTMIGGMFRGTAGPDPETARILAESEMHAEKCKLDAYRASLTNRDEQSKRDHAYRTKKLSHDFTKSVLIACASIAGIICSLYLMVIKQNTQVGTPLLVASFMALLGGKPSFGKEKE